jgi:hypothetical protein
MGILRKVFVILFSLGLAVLAPFSVWAAMSSTNYQIEFDAVGVGGLDTATSTSYELRDSLEFIQGVSNSSAYRVDQGYRGGIFDPVVQFTVFAQDSSTQVAATSITSTTVTVTTAADYSVGDYIGVIQDEGLAQVGAIGRITGVAGTTLTVDAFSYASVLPSIDGASDYVYKLTGSSLPLSSLTPSTAVTALVGWEVAADVPTGYSVYVFEDQDFQTSGGTANIDDVSDGLVSAGAEEYGGRSSDATLAASTFDTQDTGFTTNLQQVASRTNATLEARDFLTLKAAVSTGTPNGIYSHTLTVVFVGNY